jgi:hypothetical protein
VGLLDDVFSGFGGGGGGAPKFLRGNVRAGEKLLAEGERATAQIAGIRVRRGNEDSPDQYEFSLRFTGSTATTVRAGCRMSLGALLRDIRLGMEVPIRHDGRERAIIDVPAMADVAGEDAAWGYKPLDPPQDGITDDNFNLEKERRKSDAVVAAVVSVTPFEVMGLRTQNFDVRVRVTPADGGAPYETVAKRQAVPFYALHLAEPGVELPALVRPGRPDKVRIDWPAAAVADRGVGRPPAAAVAPPPPAPEAALTSSAASADWSPAGLAADDDGEVAGVGFEAWVAVEAGLVRDRVKPADHDAYAASRGIPAGEWQAVQSGWQQRMMRDPRLGARFGAEYQAALKRR